MPILASGLRSCREIALDTPLKSAAADGASAGFLSELADSVGACATRAGARSRSRQRRMRLPSSGHAAVRAFPDLDGGRYNSRFAGGVCGAVRAGSLGDADAAGCFLTPTCVADSPSRLAVSVIKSSDGRSIRAPDSFRDSEGARVPRWVAQVDDGPRRRRSLGPRTPRAPEAHSASGS